ncbi:hypothetical protein LTR35_015050 [Friedmanniomyces endolithicus]|uniref:Uncharacterized protein n=1 Tax=Friedmanniomyces endolithicus TaxID=329885 RepID=A0AAN6J1Z2_9PEZI|nr:hypothetical protein LTR35_015050 [Friedmanniomyces endolithicus]KAK0283493.1 hypothetical protein LTS00_011631 [Friedmanniomyces endolithicus]KAK0310281.1 hypothetical protein LTR82_014808 [Friedmanniomyces endolithicus]KAK0982933.1 hypothetical protein LTR54_014498 [Friedmanniomyces endolithicus]
MHHHDGIRVRLKHAKGYYEEDSNYTRSDGITASRDSLVATAQTLDAAKEEAFTFELTLDRGYQWYAASAICAVVRVGIQGQENRVLTFVVSENECSIRDGVLKGEKKIVEPCGPLPAPLVDDPHSSRRLGWSHVADPGSVLVLITRGHEHKVAARGDSGLDPPKPRYTRQINGVHTRMDFQPLKSENGGTLRFEFQVRSKGYRSTDVHAGTAAETSSGRDPSVIHRTLAMIQNRSTPQQKRLKLRLPKVEPRSPHVPRASEKSELGVDNAPFRPTAGEKGEHPVNDPLQDARPATHLPGYIGASQAQHTGTAARSLESNDIHPTAMRLEGQPSLPSVAAMEPHQQSQEAPPLVPAVFEGSVESESAALQHSKPPAQRRSDIDLTMDRDGLVVVKQEAEAPSVRKRQIHTLDEEDEDEDELGIRCCRWSSGARRRSSTGRRLS